MTTSTAAVAEGSVGVVNGPEDDLPDWRAVDWHQAEEDVRRLRQRIFAASQAGDLARVRNLHAYEPLGLLEPRCRETGKSGSEGARAQ